MSIILLHAATTLLCLGIMFTDPTNGFNILADQQRESYPQIIGHAGASGYVPESTLIGYDLAANLLADYSEPDLVLTSDLHFIAMHDLTLEATTNVADLFPVSRQETFVVEGTAITGYYVVNFTLAEIKTLTVRQQFTGRSTLYDWLFAPPTLEEIINWQINHFTVSNRLVGIYPELKHPDWYSEIGFPMEQLLLQVLAKTGYHTNDDLTPRNLRNVVPVAIQCFKEESLKILATLTNIPLIQLMGVSAEFPTPLSVWNEKHLDDIMTYAQAVGPDKKIFTTDWGTSVPQAILMRSWAKTRNLFVVPWSFQLEAKYIPLQFNGSAVNELRFFYGCLEVEGVFHEFPDHAREVVDECRKKDGGNCANMCYF
jgi:glycerophosphoryl diester phosphodiesterase